VQFTPDSKLLRSHDPYARPFLEVQVDGGTVAGTAVAWCGDMVQVKYPLITYKSGPPQHWFTSWAPKRRCRRIRSIDAPFHVEFVSSEWQREQDEAIDYRPVDTAWTLQATGVLYDRVRSMKRPKRFEDRDGLG